MKKYIRIIVVGIIIALICLASKLDVLGLPFFDVSEDKISKYFNYYYNQLELDEKKIYIRVDEAVKNKEKNVFIGSQKEIEELPKKIEKVLIAYFYDNPECYYISNKYTISTRDFKVFKYTTLGLNYIGNDNIELEIKDKKFKQAIDDIIASAIKDGMTDWEKELALHDALVEHVDYYEYEDINDIPSVKHTAYGALVEKEAVCDGYAKAFKILLDRVGIENIIVEGKTEEVAHAWNMVKIDEHYYHVDVTSDSIHEESKYVIHTYFNVSDDNISNTHYIGGGFRLPNSTSMKYSYYIQKDYYIQSEDNLYNKLSEVITKQKKSKVLEIKVAEKYDARSVIDTLFDLNFNNWRSNRENSVSYIKTGDVYFFIKE